MSRPPPDRWWRRAAGAALDALPAAALLVFVAGLALAPMAESDLFFRLAAGREIWARHAIPATNLFSFTYPEHPDLDLAWLFEVAAAGVHRAAGFGGVVAAKALVVVATMAGAYHVARRRGAGPLASALAVAAAAAVMQERLVERPHIVSFAAEIALLAWLDAHACDGRRRWWWDAALLGGVALWANLHAGAFVAPVLLGLYAAGAALDGRAAVARRTAALAAASLGALMLTPAGAGIFRYLWLHVELPRLHTVDEFRAATLRSDAALGAYALGVVAAAVALLRRGRARDGRDGAPGRYSVVLPVAGVGLLAAHTVRFGADFALLAAPLGAWGLSRLGARVAARLSPAAAAVAPPPGRAPAVVVAALLVGLAVGPRLADARPGRPFVDVGLDEAQLPLDAIRFAEANRLRDRMYNDFEIGAYLAFEGFPRHRVFIDPRLPAYPAEMHRLMGRFDLDRAEWTQAMDRYGVDSALLAYAGLNRRVSWWDPARWALVYRQHDARVFVRRLPRWRGFIAAHEIPATFTFTVEEGTATLPLDEPPESPVPACEWQRRLGDLFADIDGGDLRRALAAYRRALAAPPGCLGAADEAALRGWLRTIGAGG
jgi:hypothetical protein